MAAQDILGCKCQELTVEKGPVVCVCPEEWPENVIRDIQKGTSSFSLAPIPGLRTNKVPPSLENLVPGKIIGSIHTAVVSNHV